MEVPGVTPHANGLVQQTPAQHFGMQAQGMLSAINQVSVFPASFTGGGQNNPPQHGKKIMSR